MNNVNSALSPISVSSSDNNVFDERVRSRFSENSKSCSNDVDFFEIFGLKLYFDDILLICIIFFLYNEGVKDQGLFIALILLLLS